MVVHVGYNEDAYYRYKGTDLGDVLDKTSNNVILFANGKYIRYSG